MRLIDADALRDEWLYKTGRYEPNDVLDSIYYTPTIDSVKWIPVSKSLPDESGKYLVTSFDGHKNRTTYVQYQKKTKSWVLTGTRAYWKVLAWTHLPEPWKGEKDETD